MSERALVIVPTYNERENIRPLIESVLAKDARIDMLIVDDGSPDGTGAIVDEVAATNARVSALHRAGKMGLGTAYLEGFRWALARDYEYVFEMDADFSHNPDHLPEFLRRIEDADLVLGSRYRNGKVTVVNWPMTRLLLSYAANIYARAVTGLQLFDSTGGFKCFRREVLEKIDLDSIESKGYAFQIETTYRALRKGFTVAEVPITFVDREEGGSKMSKSIVLEAIWKVPELRFDALRGKL